MAPTDVDLAGVDLFRVLVGLLLFFAPGFAWAWAIFRDRSWARLAPLAIILGFTMEPAAMLLLNMVFGVPVTLATGVYLALALAMAGIAFRLARGFEDSLRLDL